MGNETLTTKRGHYTYEEITSEPGVWAQTLTGIRPKLDEVRSFIKGDWDEVLFIGCGSTYYLSLAAAALLQRMAGWRARGLPSSELWFYPDMVLGPSRHPLLVAISRSGTTTETRRAIEVFKAQRGPDVLAITCYPDTPVAEAARAAMEAPAAQERSIARPDPSPVCISCPKCWRGWQLMMKPT
ncbi:MAG: SIS domain-containing protein [Anaerolineae bacterium]|nr:SIS domain-containing protein [Anaerolineae bacterium]